MFVMQKHRLLTMLMFVIILIMPGIGVCSETAMYEYDDLYRLHKATYGDGTIIEYHYDEIGNITNRIVTKPNTYTITVTQSTGGTITPGTTSVTYHGSQTFTIAPDPGYHTVDVIVNGTSQGAWQSYTFSNVAADNSITATFTEDPPFRIDGKGDYAMLQDAYDSAADGDTIKCRSVIITNSLTASRNISVTIDGGYNADFSSNPTNTTLIGSMTINSGTVNIKNFNLQY